MDKCREYGKPPFRAIAIHGGPGAPGCCAGLCRGLENSVGILEHLQMGRSIASLVEEIKAIIDCYGLGQTILIGHSWGAWLSFIFASTYPELVEKLILVGSGPFEEKYLPQLAAAREKRLNEAEKQAMRETFAHMNDPNATKDEEKTAQFVQTSHGDEYCLLPGLEPDMLYFDEDQYKALFGEIVPMRASGQLLAYGKGIRCPVVAIHGRQDPHPWAGVAEPLEPVLPDFKLRLLDRCGHEPWKEKYAHEAFFRLLRSEIMAT